MFVVAGAVVVVVVDYDDDDDVGVYTVIGATLVLGRIFLEMTNKYPKICRNASAPSIILNFSDFKLKLYVPFKMQLMIQSFDRINLSN